MSRQTYATPEEALAATDKFYQQEEGFSYELEKVVDWLRAYVTLPKKGRVLDLCCGDGIWSRGMKEIAPNINYYGVDISSGGIEKARKLMPDDREQFIVADVELDLPFPDGYFDIIFARGPGLYNQHDFSHPAGVRVLENWHRKLATRGTFYSVFASKPESMGSYTPMAEVLLPYNRAPRKSDAVDFSGGKYHHSIESFHKPFWAARGVKIVKYSFIGNQHILLSRRDLS